MFTMAEFVCAFDNLKKGEAADTKLKNCATDTKVLICDTLNMIIDQNKQASTIWKQALIKVIHEKARPNSANKLQANLHSTDVPFAYEPLMSAVLQKFAPRSQGQE